MFLSFDKILDRNFVFGYILPTLIFITIASFMLFYFYPNLLILLSLLVNGPNNATLNNSINYESSQIAFISSLILLQNFTTLSIVLFLVIIISIIFTVLNLSLIRIMEGYFIIDNKRIYNLSRVFKYQFNKYKSIQGELHYLANRYHLEINCYGKVTPDTQKNYNELSEKLRNEFPDNEKYILPTSFGNTIRAFEVYSRVVYGLDSIPSWNRIIAVVPNDYRELLNSTKSQVDFSVNFFYFMILLAIESLILVLLNGSYRLFILPAIFLALCYIAYRLAIYSAFEWGQFVKSIYDLYRYDLLLKMKIKIPNNLEDERKCWNELSKMFLFWDEANIERDLSEKKN
jgi:hypothetical protein